jgi:hypothetical protein
MFRFVNKKIFFLILFFAICGTVFHLVLFEKSSMFKYDGGSYYSYLPAFLIYHDPGFHNAEKLNKETNNLIPLAPMANGFSVPKMTMGIAILLAPFFLLAHWTTLLFGATANGYTFIYALFVSIASLFYFLSGLLIINKVLFRFYQQSVVNWVILILGIGTNLFNYALLEPTMTHNYEFFLFALFLYLTLVWHDKPTIKNSLLIGFVTGLITLIRPSDLVVVLFFLLYKIVNREDVLKKWKLFRENYIKLLVISISGLIVVTLQMIYWKIYAGNFYYDTYSSEHFFFDNPHLLGGLIGFRKGWLLYTPVMVLIIPGIYLLLKRKNIFSKGILYFLLINVFILFSWWCWWYGASFGCRPIVDSYALLSIPLAETISSGSGTRKKLLIGFIVFCIALNLFQTYQYERGIIHYESMSNKSYFTSFGKLKLPSEYLQLMKVPDTEYALLGFDERKGELGNFPYLKEQGRMNVNIKAWNGKFVGADFTKFGSLVANRDVAADWEHFEIAIYQYDRCLIKGFQNLFVSSDANQSNHLSASRPIAAGWELFTLIDLGNNKFILRDINDKFVEVDSVSKELKCATNIFNEAQILTMIPLK